MNEAGGLSDRDKKVSRRDLLRGAGIVVAAASGTALSREVMMRSKEGAKKNVQYERVGAFARLDRGAQNVLAKRQDILRFDPNTGAIGILDRNGSRSFYRGPVDTDEVQEVYGRLDGRSALVFEYIHKNGDTDTLRLEYDFSSGEIVVDESAGGGTGDQPGRKPPRRGLQDI